MWVSRKVFWGEFWDFKSVVQNILQIKISVGHPECKVIEKLINWVLSFELFEHLGIICSHYNWSIYSNRVKPPQNTFPTYFRIHPSFIHYKRKEKLETKQRNINKTMRKFMISSQKKDQFQMINSNIRKTNMKQSFLWLINFSHAKSFFILDILFLLPWTGPQQISHFLYISVCLLILPD